MPASHPTVAAGPNDPTKQVSSTAWNQDHTVALTDGEHGARGASLHTDSHSNANDHAQLHHTAHEPAGGDAMAADAAAGTASLRSLSTTATTAAAGNHTTPAMTASVAGHVPTPPNNTTTFLRGDGTFAAVAYGAVSGTPTAFAPTVVNDEGTVTVPDTGYLGNRERLTATGTERATLVGTGRAALFDPTVPFMGSYAPGSFTLQPDGWVLQYSRLDLRANQRATLRGNARLIATSFAPSGRLALTGVGGGS